MAIRHGNLVRFPRGEHRSLKVQAKDALLAASGASVRFEYPVTGWMNRGDKFLDSHSGRSSKLPGTAPADRPRPLSARAGPAAEGAYPYRARAMDHQPSPC